MISSGHSELNIPIKLICIAEPYIKMSMISQKIVQGTRGSLSNSIFSQILAVNEY